MLKQAPQAPSTARTIRPTVESVNVLARGPGPPPVTRWTPSQDICLHDQPQAADEE